MTLLYSDDSAYLTTEEPTRYVLGDLDAPLLTLNAADEFGVMWVCPEPDGWDAPTAETPFDRRQDGHGSYAGETTYEARTLSFTGSAEGPSYAATRAARGRLLRAWSHSVQTGEPILYTHLDEDPVVSLWVVPNGQPKLRISDGRWLDFAFVLVAEDPIKFGEDTPYGPVRLPSGATAPGLVTPLTTPLTVVGAATASTVVYVANTGDEDAHALYTITGPIPQPIVQVASGEFLGLRLDLAATDTAQIDTAAGTITVNGVNRYDAWLAGSTFPLIPPGGAEVRLRSGGGSTSQVPGLTITTAPRYR